MSRKKWIVSERDLALSSEISERFDISPIVSLILTSRGITEDERIDEFLSDYPDFQNPADIADMMKAKEAVERALEEQLKIAVYGDYDADGITATCILYKYLKKRGADAVWYVPERSEGYGLNTAAIDKLSREGVGMIITVDNGIAAVDEAEYAKKLGISVVITDHHEPHEVLPDALAVVDPHRADCPSAYKDYAGVGVAFKLICAMEDAFGDGVVSLLKEYGEYVAIGTIADIVPLTGENRLLVKYGISALGSTSKPDITALKEIAGVKNDAPVNAQQVAFGMAPRLNACGRVGFAREAVELFLSDDPVSARDVAEGINLYNYERKRLEDEAFNEADGIIIQSKSYLTDRVIVVGSEGWSEGVIGIVSARITEKYGKPSVVLTVKDGAAKGSCRSVEGFRIYDALKAVSPYLRKFGGHAMAAGVSVDADKIETFRVKINEYARENFNIMPFPVQRIDCKINTGGISREFLSALQAIEPTGAGNPPVTFGLFKMQITRVSPVSDGKYVRLSLAKNGASVDAICFSMSADEFPYSVGDVIDAAVRLSESKYAGGVSVRITDLRMSGSYEDELLKSMRIYEKTLRGEKLTDDELKDALPDREVFAAVYRFIKGLNGKRIHSEMLYHRLQRKYGYASVMLCLDVMEELGLISVSRDGDRVAAVTNPEAGKRDLNESEILRELKGRKR